MGHNNINDEELLEYIVKDFKSGIQHGILVANLTYELAKRMELSESECYELKIAGMLHDIGKLKLSEYLQHENPPGLSGWLCEGRIYFDAFVLKNKKDGIFVSVNSSYVADKAVTGE